MHLYLSNSSYLKTKNIYISFNFSLFFMKEVNVTYHSTLLLIFFIFNLRYKVQRMLDLSYKYYA